MAFFVGQDKKIMPYNVRTEQNCCICLFLMGWTISVDSACFMITRKTKLPPQLVKTKDEVDFPASQKRTWGTEILGLYMIIYNQKLIHFQWLISCTLPVAKQFDEWCCAHICLYRSGTCYLASIQAAHTTGNLLSVALPKKHSRSKKKQCLAPHLTATPDPMTHPDVGILLHISITLQSLVAFFFQMRWIVY